MRILKISVAIPTRNRPESLKNLLLSIIQQTRLPEEVSIIDDSSDSATERLVKDYCVFFSNKGISLRYFRGKEENKSISAARNIGITKSNGEIVFFIDDDILLFKKYIDEILKVYQDYPLAQGVQGYIVNYVFAFSNFGNFVLNAVKKIFMLDHVEKNKCSARKGLVYPYSPDGILQCEWLHGSNMSFRKEAIECFRFDEKLRGHSIGEDVAFTSKILEHYPFSLFMNPAAKVFHVTTAERKLDKRVTHSNIPYLVYLSNSKGQEPTFREVFQRFWFLFGMLIVDGGVPLLTLGNAQPLISLIRSFFATFNHLGNVKMGDFRFIESMKKA